MKPFEYIVPETLKDALAEAGKGGQLKSSGIDLLDLLKSNLSSPEKIISLLSVEELRALAIDAKGAKIGAAQTLAELAGHAQILKRWTALAQSCNEAATPQVRNRATLGGNLCQRPRCGYFRSPDFDCLKKGGQGCPATNGENRYHAIFDTSPCPIVHASNAAIALVALGASLTIVSAKESREVSIDEFFVLPKDDLTRENILKPGEIVSHVTLADRGWKSAYLEFREKQSFDYALVACAAAAEMDGATFKKGRVVLGAVAPAPKLLPKVAAFLEGKKIDPDVALKAGDLAVEGATPLPQNEYKIQQARIAVKRTLLALAEVK